MGRLKRTALYERHLALGAKMIEFAGWEMPLTYPAGTIEEHLATRRHAGLFDVSHMGRFMIRGNRNLAFLQRALTNNAAALDALQSHYTLISNERGGAIDDAYLYRFAGDEFILVVNASNCRTDFEHLLAVCAECSGVELNDHTTDLAMLSLQGPRSRDIIESLLESGSLPEPRRNELSVARMAGHDVRLSRTGYTGEPLCFELMADGDAIGPLWDLLVAGGATPCGLGARDTLRLEAGLPLYGHELGQDPEGNDIPILASPLAAFAVSFSLLKGDYVGRSALSRQYEAWRRILYRDYSLVGDLPRLTRTVTVVGRGVAREGSQVFKGDRHVGWVTSGTAVPYWKIEGEGLASRFIGEHALRSICLAYLDSDIVVDDRLSIDVRGKELEAVVVPYHLRSEAPPYARPIVVGLRPPTKAVPQEPTPARARRLLEKTLDNHTWRQEKCINLIPSEMTTSPLVRLVSAMDPAFRYAEHRKLEAFYDSEVFYYQGTGFIHEVEQALEAELGRFLGCAEIETRVISGQMANMAVFSAVVEYLNRGDRKKEPRRIAMVMNNHIGRGGHLSAQPMGALKDFVATDPRTERPAVVNFPVLPENPYKVDLARTFELIDQYRPEIMIFGKSMVLHREPVAEVRRFLDERGYDALVMYDMAHVLGLTGPHFQQPFDEGVDLVTGSTHKTFFGTQRGLVGCDYAESEERYELWEAVRRRTFPGSVSNHHLGTMVGLLLATYEMNHFKAEYQPKVIANAKAFARALSEQGIPVAGDPAIDFTETHQVIVEVGYGRGPEMAKRLEANDIICNYQASPDEEGFTASGALRMGSAEMTRFGMQPSDFGELARLVAAVIRDGATVTRQVDELRSGFRQLRYCFDETDYPDAISELRARL